METVEKKYIVGIGEILWDMLPEGKKMGGAPANFAYHASQLGLESWAVSAVGCDSLGDEIISQLEERNMNVYCIRAYRPTGTVQVELDDEGIPQYEIKEDVAWDMIPFTSELHDMALQTRAVCFGTLAQRSAMSRSSINRFLDSMPDDKGIYKIFDVNLRQHFYTKDILTDSMRKCNVLKINDEELCILTEMLEYPSDDIQGTGDRLMKEYGIDIVILTCGTEGSYIFSHGNTSYVYTPEVEVADTVGAGDSFTAAFIASLLKGEDIRTAHRFAVDVAAYVCTQKGAMPALPYNLKK